MNTAKKIAMFCFCPFPAFVCSIATRPFFRSENLKRSLKFAGSDHVKKPGVCEKHRAFCRHAIIARCQVRRGESNAPAGIAAMRRMVSCSLAMIVCEDIARLLCCRSRESTNLYSSLLRRKTLCQQLSSREFCRNRLFSSHSFRDDFRVFFAIAVASSSAS